MMWYMDGNVHWWGWFLAFGTMVAFWGLIVWAVWFFVAGSNRDDRNRNDLNPDRNADRNPDRSPGTAPAGPGFGVSDDPQVILDRRLARGEIDAEEYRRLTALLREHRPGSGDRPPVGSAGPR